MKVKEFWGEVTIYLNSPDEQRRRPDHIQRSSKMTIPNATFTQRATHTPETPMLFTLEGQPSQLLELAATILQDVASDDPIDARARLHGIVWQLREIIEEQRRHETWPGSDSP